MTRILFINDIHSEFHNKKHSLPFDQDAFDLVSAAGDIGVGVEGLMWLRTTFPDKEIVKVAGNHTTWRRGIIRHYEKLHAKARTLGIHFLQNEHVVLNGIKFIGATLWTDFKLFGNQPLAMYDARENLNDYGYRDSSQRFHPNIRVHTNKPITPEFILAEHEKSRKYIFEELDVPFDGKRVVITHHAPTGESISKRYVDDNVTPCYASDLGNMICYANNPPVIWHHGHVHVNSDYMCGDTRIVCNPYGYYDQTGNGLNKEFNPNFIIEV